ncbi:HNH endonuclease, partial [Ideonella sp. B508-1]|uniref:HNH endonuclease n=1 Tax=Ideonella sp. B508-1 TaxID=137716 RepID=UPI0011D1E35D
MSHQQDSGEKVANTCIVCGQAAGSGEHVFPASLGGRRTNRNIYCTKHDNGYSGLVADLASQFAVLNAMLGVVPDHSDDVQSVLARDKNTGEELRMSFKESSFTAPRVISQEPVANGTRMEMAFPNREAMNAWLAEQKANGVSVTPLQKAQERTYILGEVHHQRCFGGPCGLGAVAYVTQTFLAQAFPDLARSGDVAQFIAYTQAIAQLAQIRGGCGDAP